MTSTALPTPALKLGLSMNIHSNASNPMGMTTPMASSRGGGRTFNLGGRTAADIEAAAAAEANTTTDNSVAQVENETSVSASAAVANSFDAALQLPMPPGLNVQMPQVFDGRFSVTDQLQHHGAMERPTSNVNIFASDNMEERRRLNDMHSKGGWAILQDGTVDHSSNAEGADHSARWRVRHEGGLALGGVLAAGQRMAEGQTTNHTHASDDLLGEAQASLFSGSTRDFSRHEKERAMREAHMLGHGGHGVMGGAARIEQRLNEFQLARNAETAVRSEGYNVQKSE